MSWTTTEIASSAFINMLIFGGIFWASFRPAKGDIARVLAVAWMPLVFVIFVALFKNGFSLEQRLAAVGVALFVTAIYLLAVGRSGYFLRSKVDHG